MDKVHEIVSDIEGHLIQCAKENAQISFTEEDFTNLCDD